MKVGILYNRPLLSLAFLTAVLCGSYDATGKSVGNRGPGVPDREVRAVWVVRNSIKTRKSIQAVIDAMKRNNFNVAIVQVRGRGDAFYRSDFVPRAQGIEKDLDPLAEFIRLAKPAGISVHVWVNLFLGADTETKNASPEHLVHAHKDWFLRDKNGRSMLDYSPAEWRKARVEGAFLDPANIEVRRHTLRVIEELLDRYAVDGLHMDYVRYPASIPGTVYDFGLASAQEAAGIKSIPKTEPVRPDAGKTSAADPAKNATAKTDPKLEAAKSDVTKQVTAKSETAKPEPTKPVPDTVRPQFITKMVSEIRTLTRRKYPRLILSAAVWPSRERITMYIFQPWPDWLHHGTIDYAFLMSYYDTKEMHDARLGEFLDPRINKKMVIGIGAYKNPRADVVSHQLASARGAGAAGVCFFDAEWLLKRDLLQKQALQHAAKFPAKVPAKQPSKDGPKEPVPLTQGAFQEWREHGLTPSL